MGGRPRLLVIGLVALVAVLAGTRTASSEPASHHVVHGEVTSGTVGGPEWRVDHVATGRYRVEFRSEAELDVTEWGGTGDVTLVPLGGGATEVRFGNGADADFEFVALVAD